MITQIRAKQQTEAQLRAENVALRRQVAELKRQASTDPLTGIANRGSFDRHLASELNRAQRQQHPMSLILIDIDHFKRFNDTRGHQAGDELLKQVASLWNQCAARPGDLAARYGGEEFAVILPHTDTYGAIAVANRLQVAAKLAGVTISMGISEVREADSPDGMIALADERMYQAKHSGRAQHISKLNACALQAA